MTRTTVQISSQAHPRGSGSSTQQAASRQQRREAVRPQMGSRRISSRTGCRKTGQTAAPLALRAARHSRLSSQQQRCEPHCSSLPAQVQGCRASDTEEH